MYTKDDTEIDLAAQEAVLREQVWLSQIIRQCDLRHVSPPSKTNLSFYGIQEIAAHKIIQNQRFVLSVSMPFQICFNHECRANSLHCNNVHFFY